MFNTFMVQRKTYDTRVKYLVMKGLLPDLYRKQIHKSLISKWKRESPDKYTGYELNDSIEELYELMKKISGDQRLLRTIRAFYRINKTLKDIIGTGNDYIKRFKEFKFQIVETIQRCKKTIGINEELNSSESVQARIEFRQWNLISVVDNHLPSFAVQPIRNN